MAALAQAQAQSPKNIQKQLKNAGQQLAKANQNLQKAAPKQAGDAQKDAAAELAKALDTLNAALMAKDQAPSSPANPRKPRPRTVPPCPAKANPAWAKTAWATSPEWATNPAWAKKVRGEKMAKAAKVKPRANPAKAMSGTNLCQGKRATAKPTAKSRMVAHRLLNRRLLGDVGLLHHLPPRQRELIRQAMSGNLPPEYAASIQQYYINIARGRRCGQRPGGS